MDNNEENKMEATFEPQGNIDAFYRTQFTTGTRKFSIHEFTITITETMTLTELLDFMPTAIGKTGLAKGGVCSIQTDEGIISHRLGMRNLVTHRGANNKNVIFQTWEEMEDPNTPDYMAEWIDEGEVEIEYIIIDEGHQALVAANREAVSLNG